MIKDRVRRLVKQNTNEKSLNQIIYPYRLQHNGLDQRSLLTLDPIETKDYHSRISIKKQKILKTEQSKSPTKERTLSRYMSKTKTQIRLNKSLSRVSPDQRRQFSQKLKMLDRNILELRYKLENVDDSIPKLLDDMKQNLNVRYQPKDLLKIRINSSNMETIEIEDQIVQKSFNQNDAKKIQRMKFNNSEYYKSVRWLQIKGTFLRYLEQGTTKHLKNYYKAKLKIPFLREHSKELYKGLKQKNYIIVSKLIGLNSYLIHEIDNSMQSPLHISAALGSFEICRLLIRFGIDVNCVDKNMKTPLYYACWGGHQNIVKLLIVNGANPWSEENCDFGFFTRNKMLNYLFKVARRVFTILLLTPKKRKQDVKLYIDSNYLQDFKFPNNLL